ncbi:carbohydrate ABC transporter permease [Turicibacter bilis]|uniref:Carbohydrate ABC transporter permease n=1 Tax=Turicibacter bilis TaxID=2735723 RepID=A0A9Q9CQD7_9FIRM|nr:carbohydrate ABC transporter permease [Turicibacter bilis]MBS3198618.1 carbohydrate ABC transporter permease [Turicibacter bilis]MBS3199304.1 carbohydrate ABC transporter permease [Turicibacter bilis]UUF05780.1 carbohydrate ABC transporter permease [Turicibacter bilis]UUF08777.1 carbohydrate ABC transporter permease [Turicibacter bilis]
MKKKKINKGNLIVHLVLIIGSVIMILPFAWMILTSFKTLAESTQMPPKIFPDTLQFSNYTEVMRLLPFDKFYINTILMLLFRVIGSVLFSAMAAYAFARLNFPGKNFFFSLVLLQMMVPGQLFIIPQFLLVQKLGLLNTVTALVIPGIVSAFGTFLLRQFFMGIPKELEEAAKLDGCSIGRTFFSIMLPLANSGLVALGIFTALFAFKDLMWPLIVNMSIDKMTLSAGLASLQGQFSTNFPQLMAGSLLAVWPMLLIFVIFQRKFIEGIATTGGKL